MTPDQHYRRADELLEHAGAQRDRLKERIGTGQVGYAEGELAVRSVALTVALAQAHATLATVTP